jgi:hypothetical protein
MLVVDMLFFLVGLADIAGPRRLAAPSATQGIRPDFEVRPAPVRASSLWRVVPGPPGCIRADAFPAPEPPDPV